MRLRRRWSTRCTSAARRGWARSSPSCRAILAGRPCTCSASCMSRRTPAWSTASSKARPTTRVTLPASSAGSRANSPPSSRRVTGPWPSRTRRSYSATTPRRCGTSSCSGSRRAAGAFEPNGSTPRKRGSSLVALLALDRPGDHWAALALAMAGRVLLGPPRPVGYGEDLERRHLGRRLQEAAIRLGGRGQQRPKPLAVEKHRVTQHVHGAGGGLRHDVVLTELVLASLEHPGFLAKPPLYFRRS